LAKIAVPFISWEPAVVFPGGLVFHAVGADEIGGSDNLVVRFQGQIIRINSSISEIMREFHIEKPKKQLECFFVKPPRIKKSLLVQVLRLARYAKGS